LSAGSAVPGEIGDAVPGSEAERARLRRTWLGFFAMIAGVFMAFLDIQIVASSLNQIQAGLSATAQEMSWVQSSYLIAEVIAIPLSGYLTRVMSTRIYFTISVLGFTAASALCATAWSIESMMVFRALQGFLGGGMIPASFAALYLMFPPEKRVVPQVLAGLVATSAPTLGPVLGGWITGVSSWHWLFLINLLPGLLVGLAVWTLVDIDRPDWKLWRIIDLRGVISMALFLGSLEWVLEEGPAHGWLDDDGIAFWATVAALSGGYFFHRVLTWLNPIVDLRPFRNPHFLAANVAAMLLNVSLFAANYVLPLFLGQVRDFNSMQIGNTLMVSGVAMFLAAPFAARLARRFDMRHVFAIGSLMVAIGSFLMADLTRDTGFAELALPQFLRGAGFMIALVCCSTLSLSSLPIDAVKNASALFSLMRNLGGALGLAAVNSLMFWRREVHDQHLTESLSLSREPVREFVQGMSGMLPGSHEATLAMAQLAQRLGTQSLILSYNDALIAMAWLGCLAVPIFLFVKRPVIPGGPPQPGH
jgi:DHA2 family multidrug resistance protein